MSDISLDELGCSMVVFEQRDHLARDKTICAAETKEDREDEGDDVVYDEVHEVPNGADLLLDLGFGRRR